MNTVHNPPRTFLKGIFSGNEELLYTEASAITQKLVFSRYKLYKIGLHATIPLTIIVGSRGSGKGGNEDKPFFASEINSLNFSVWKEKK